MGTQETLGSYLKQVRKSRGLTLRRVEEITEGKVSDGYLSQIETGKIDAPSILMLHRLSAAYAIDFTDLCERAVWGTAPSQPNPPRCPTCGQVFP